MAGSIYLITAIIGLGGALFGYDIGIISGVLDMHSFKHDFNITSCTYCGRACTILAPYAPIHWLCRASLAYHSSPTRSITQGMTGTWWSKA